MGVAREKVQAFEKRMEGVRQRVEGWERREKEGWQKSRRIWGTLWGMLGAIVGLLTVAAVVRNWPDAERLKAAGPIVGNAMGRSIEAFRSKETGSLCLKGEVIVDDGMKRIEGGNRDDVRKGIREAREAFHPDEPDPVLSIFDDL